MIISNENSAEIPNSIKELEKFFENLKLDDPTFSYEAGPVFDSTISPTDSKSQSNMKQASENRSRWISFEQMKNDPQQAHLNIEIIKTTLVEAITELNIKFPRIAQNANSLNSANVTIVTGKLKQKLVKSGHYRDLLPNKLYPELKEDITMKDLDSKESIEADDYIVLIVLAKGQIRTFIDASTTKKSFGATIKMDNVDGKLVPAYLPVLMCYHELSGFLVMIKIPSLEFLTAFPLDNYQILMKSHVGVILPPYEQTRKFDNCLQNMENLPPSFLEVNQNNKIFDWFETFNQFRENGDN